MAVVVVVAVIGCVGATKREFSSCFAKTSRDLSVNCVFAFERKKEKQRVSLNGL